MKKIEDTVSKVEEITGCKCVAQFQWDGAGVLPGKEFTLCGWLLVPQPSQSPVSNVMNCNIFSSMSKRGFGAFLVGEEWVHRFGLLGWFCGSVGMFTLAGASELMGMSLPQSVIDERQL